MHVMPQMHVSAGRTTPVLPKGVHAGTGLRRLTLGELHTNAVPLHVSPPDVAVNDTCVARRRVRV